MRMRTCVVENGDDDRLRIRDHFGDSENRVFDEELGEDRLQKFRAIDVFGFFGLAERDERDDGVIAVGRGARGRVVGAKNIFFGCRGGGGTRCISIRRASRRTSADDS